MAARTHAAVGKKRKVVRLSKEAFKTVEENANEITTSLLESTKKGKVMSARLLVELAEGDVDVEEGMTVGPLRSLALQLAREAQYKAPASGESSQAEVPHRAKPDPASPEA